MRRVERDELRDAAAVQYGAHGDGVAREVELGAAVHVRLMQSSAHDHHTSELDLRIGGEQAGEVCQRTERDIVGAAQRLYLPVQRVGPALFAIRRRKRAQAHAAHPVRTVHVFRGVPAPLDRPVRAVEHWRAGKEQAGKVYGVSLCMRMRNVAVGGYDKAYVQPFRRRDEQGDGVVGAGIRVDNQGTAGPHKRFLPIAGFTR